MKFKPRRNSALALIGLLIFLAAVIIIAGAIIYLLIKLCRKVFPPPGSNADPVVEVIETFPPIVLNLPSNPGLSQGFVQAVDATQWKAEVQRSTNLVDWQPILVTNGDFQFGFDCDTNPPADRAFYRLRYFR